MTNVPDRGSTTARVYAPWAERPVAAPLLALSLFLLRVAYLVWWCPYTLVEDEAQYWEWSRRLDWSYYSKGPGVAWAIAASTRVFGTSEWAVRLPSAISLLVASLGAAALAREAFGTRRAAFFAVVLVNCVPLFQSAGLMMTIDMPYAACWMLGAWAFWRAVSRGSGPALVAAALAVGAGFLFKYTALLIVPGFIGFWFLAERRSARRPSAGWVALSFVVLGACVAPVVAWNAQHGWPTVKHLLGHVGVEGGDRPAWQNVRGWSYSPLWTLEYVGAQIGQAGPMLGLALIGYLEARKRRRDEPGGWFAARFLVWCAAPLLLFYLLVTLFAPAQQNWALAAYTTLAVLGAGALVRGLDEFVARLDAWRAIPEPRPRAGFLVRRPETAPQVLWHATLVYGLVTGLGFACARPASRLPLVGHLIPVHRLLGADARAAHVARLLEGLRARGETRPFVLAHHYGVAAQMAFYLPGRPVTFCSSAYAGGRRTQYDFFPDTDLARVTPGLVEHSAVVLGATEEHWSTVFERVEPVGKLDGEKKDDRPAFLGFNFRGFATGGLAP